MPPMPQYGIPGGGGPKFTALRELLSQEHTVIDADLTKGQVPSEADILILAAPEELSEKEVFAVDQFLMQGGTVIVAASPYTIDLRGKLSMTAKKPVWRIGSSITGLCLNNRWFLIRKTPLFPYQYNEIWVVL